MKERSQLFVERIGFARIGFGCRLGAGDGIGGPPDGTAIQQEAKAGNRNASQR